MKFFAKFQQGEHDDGFAADLEAMTLEEAIEEATGIAFNHLCSPEVERWQESLEERGEEVPPLVCRIEEGEWSSQRWEGEEVAAFQIVFGEDGLSVERLMV